MTKDYQKFWKGVTSTSNEGKAVRTLARIVLDREGRTFVLNLERNDAELCMEILDRGIAEHKLRATEQQAFLVALGELAATRGRLPKSMMITEEIDVSDEILVSGGYADVRTGMYKGDLVAVKTMRVAAQDDFLEIRKKFCKEVLLWNTLSHPNVLKLAGVRFDMDQGRITTVSEWMIHGNIMEFIRKNHVNRLELLHEAAQGLSYLHDCAGLTHGDLKGANILMSNDSPPRACLTDFGFMTMVLDHSHPMSCSAQLEGGTLMFMSPELFGPSGFGFTESKHTPEADIYAFGLVIHQVLTGKPPFLGLGMAEIALNVVQGMRPPKPENASVIGFSDSLWCFVQRCWDGEMGLRPKVAEVVSQLGKAGADWDGVMPPCARVESITSTSLEPALDSTAHYGVPGSSLGVVPESPTRTVSTSSNPPSVPSTQLTEGSSAETLGVTIKSFSGPELEFVVRDAAVRDDRNLQRIRQTNDNQVWAQSVRAPPFQGRPLYNTPPQQDPPIVYHLISRALYPSIGSQTTYPSEYDRPQPELRAPTQSQKEKPCNDIPRVHPHLEQRYEPPPSRLPEKGWRGFRYFLRHLMRYCQNPQALRKLLRSDLPTHQEGVAARDFCGIKEASTQRAPPLPAISLRNAKAAINQSQQPRIFDRLSLQLPNQIADNLGEEQPWGCVSFPQDEGVVQRVEELDRILSTLDVASPDFVTYLHEFGYLCGAWEVLPKFLEIPDVTLLIVDGQPFASGALTDIHEGSLGSLKVRVEKVRVYLDRDPQKVGEMLCKGAAMRKHLKHPNVVPFLGATLDPPQFFSGWVANGGLIGYTAAHPEQDRLELLYDVAQGLSYLHEHGIVHGDLRASNILIDASGHACIAGLDLIVTISDSGPIAYFTEKPSARLAAPEILDGSTTFSKASDVFSFAMLMIEVFTGAAPFKNSSPTTVGVRILSGIRPNRPAHPSFTDELWDLSRDCWHQKPSLRPGILKVVSRLRNALIVQDDHADGTDVSTTSTACKAVSSNQRRKPSHRLRREPTHSTAPRLFLMFPTLLKPSKREGGFDEFLDVESNASGDTLNASPEQGGFLQGATFWSPDRGARSGRNHRGGSDTFGEKHGNANNGPPTPDHNFLCFPLWRSNKCGWGSGE